MLKEQSILNSFYDFACTLEENEMLASEKETQEFLQSILRQNTAAAASLSL